MTHSSSPLSEGQVPADQPIPISPVQSRLRWLEIATRLLLLASMALFAWAAMSVFIRPIARKLIEEPRSSPISLGDDGHDDSPIDFYRQDVDSDDDVGPRRPREPLRGSARATDDDNDDEPRKDGKKAELVPGKARKNAKLYGQPSEKSVEMGEVRAGESIFIMKEATDWVLVLRGEGAMLGWMRRDNLATP